MHSNFNPPWPWTCPTTEYQRSPLSGWLQSESKLGHFGKGKWEKINSKHKLSFSERCGYMVTSCKVSMRMNIEDKVHLWEWNTMTMCQRKWEKEKRHQAHVILFSFIWKRTQKVRSYKSRSSRVSYLDHDLPAAITHRLPCEIIWGAMANLHQSNI